MLVISCSGTTSSLVNCWVVKLNIANIVKFCMSFIRKDGNKESLLIPIEAMAKFIPENTANILVNLVEDGEGILGSDSESEVSETDDFSFSNEVLNEVIYSQLFVQKHLNAIT